VSESIVKHADKTSADLEEKLKALEKELKKEKEERSAERQRYLTTVEKLNDDMRDVSIREASAAGRLHATEAELVKAEKSVKQWVRKFALTILAPAMPSVDRYNV
jgi:Skp family chaperone for outer membrane proteins